MKDAMKGMGGMGAGAAGGGAGMQGIVPDEDLAPLFAEIDAMSGGMPPSDEGAGIPGTEPAPGEVPPAEAVGEAVDAQPIADALSVPLEKAERIYKAAQKYDNMAGMTPEDIGTKLSSDYRTLMQIEEDLAREDDEAAYNDELDMDEESESEGAGAKMEYM